MGILLDPRARDAIARFHGLGTSGAPQIVTPSASESTSFANDPLISLGGISVSPLAATSSSVALTPTIGLAQDVFPAVATSSSVAKTPSILVNISTAPVQQVATSHSAASTTFNFVLGAAPTINDVLILAGAAGATTQYITGISQTGVTWTEVRLSHTNRAAFIWVGIVGSGASATGTVTTNDLGSVVTVRTNVSEWAGLNLSVTSDTSSGNSGSSNVATTASITPTASRNVLLIAAARYGAGTFTSGPTNSFTALTTQSNFYPFAYRVVSSTSGSYSTSWTYTSTDTWETAIAAFRNPD